MHCKPFRLAQLAMVLSFLALAATAQQLETASPEWGTKGKFEAPIDFPPDSPVMIHASVLPDGKVIFWGREKELDASGETINDVVGHSKVRIWNPVTGVIETVDNGTTNLFCSGHSVLSDGRLFVTGGHQHWQALRSATTR